MKLLAGFLALAFTCFATPALAEDDVTLMKVLDFETLRGIADELDHVVIEEGIDEDGDFYFEVESDTGLRFTLYGANCDEDDPSAGCADLNVVGTFPLAEDADVYAAMSSISYAFMKVYRSGGDIRISRYVTFHGGITRENVKENIRIFAEIGDLVWEKLDTAGVLAD